MMKLQQYVFFLGLLFSFSAGAAPVVFWGPDNVAPGNVVLLCGGGLGEVTELTLQSLPDGKPLTVPAIQACDNSVKFVLPSDFPVGVFSAKAGGGKPFVINRPEVWFLQPTVLLPGLNENQASPGTTVQVVGKSFLLGHDKGTPRISLTRDGKAVEVTAEKAEKFSLQVKLPPDLAEGRYELKVHNGFGGGAGWGDPVAVEIKKSDMWPDKVFDVKKFGAKGDDVADDTAAIREALAAADKNGGGIVQFSWGTYRLTNWFCIPPRTVVRGESRDSTILKWPVDEPQSVSNFRTAAIFGAPPYALEDLTIIVRKSDTALMDLSWEHSYPRNVPVELLPKMRPWGQFRDVFIRRIYFQNWLWCGHPERQPELMKKFWGEPYHVRIGGVHNFEISDCLFQGANNYFANIRNARIARNAIANGMGGHSWTCLGGGAQFTVCEINDLNCSSSWGWGWSGLQKVYSAHNVSHNYVRGEREAMTLDISALPTARPVNQYWGVPSEVSDSGSNSVLRFPAAGTTNLDGFSTGWTPGCFKGGVVILHAYDGGPGTNQTRNVIDNTADTVTVDRPFKPVPDTTPRRLYVEIAPRHYRAHGGTTAWIGRLSESQPAAFTAIAAKWIPDEFIGMAALVISGKGAGQYRVVTANKPDQATLDQPWDVTPDTNSVIGIWSLMRHMIVYKCEGYDTSAFGQMYGSFYDYIVDSCKVERSQGLWGQMGWFVQFRDNAINYANSYHPGIGARGPNPEKCVPFGYTGLDGTRLRITKAEAFQYPGMKVPLFADDVVGVPVPTTLAHIQRGNTLSYGQRLQVQMWTNEGLPGPRPGGGLFRDVVIDGNKVAHSAVGIQLGPNVTGAVVANNTFADVEKPLLLARPENVMVIEPKH